MNAKIKAARKSILTAQNNKVTPQQKAANLYIYTESDRLITFLQSDTAMQFKAVLCIPNLSARKVTHLSTSSFLT